MKLQTKRFFNIRSRGSKFLSVALAFALVFSTVAPTFASPSGGIVSIKDFSGGNGGSKSDGSGDVQNMAETIYFGKYNNTAILWRVLANNTDPTGQSTTGNGILLFSDEILYDHVFRSDSDKSYSNIWGDDNDDSIPDSDIRTQMNGTGDGQFLNSSNFGTAEVNAIAETSLNTPKSGTAHDTTDRVFLLTSDDVQNSAYGFSDSNSRIATDSDGTASPWWLRSPNVDYDNTADEVVPSGDVISDDVAGEVGVRPTLNLNQESVLFLTNALETTGETKTGKNAVEVSNGYTLDNTYDGSNGWKLTLIDSTIAQPDVTVTQTSETESIENHISDGTLDLTSGLATTYNEDLAITYNAAGGGTYTSAILIDNATGAYLNYAKLAGSATPTGTNVIYNLYDEIMSEGSYKLLVFSENVKGNYATDYASTPLSFTIGKGTAATWEGILRKNLRNNVTSTVLGNGFNLSFEGATYITSVSIAGDNSTATITGSGTTIGGTVTVGSGQTLNVAGDFTLSGDVANNGTMNLTGDKTLSGSVANNGTMNLTGDKIVFASTLSGDSGKTVVASGTSVEFGGSFAQGEIDMATGATMIYANDTEATNTVNTFNLAGTLSMNKSNQTKRQGLRTLSITAIGDNSSFNVSDGTLVINTNLAESTGDTITISNFATVTGDLKVQIAYDPYYDDNSKTLGSHTFLTLTDVTDASVFNVTGVPYLYKAGGSHIVYVPIISKTDSSWTLDSIIGVSRRYALKNYTGSDTYGVVTIGDEEKRIVTGENLAWGRVGRGWSSEEETDDNTLYYTWHTADPDDDTDTNRLVDTTDSGKADIKVVYDGTKPAVDDSGNPERKTEYDNYTIFKGIDTKITEGASSYDAGGALKLTSSEKDLIIKSDFVENSLTTSLETLKVVAGGALAVDFAENVCIYYLTGDFIANNITSNDANFAYGGAIYYNRGSIGTITADFAGNNIVTSGRAFGGAIYIQSGNVTAIMGDFIGNYAQGDQAGGGAIYTSGSVFGSIEGNFVGNYSKAASANIGGAIENSGSLIKSIKGDFIGNYSTVSSGMVAGGAIANYGTDYRESNEISSILGDFTANYVSVGIGLAAGGAILNFPTNKINTLQGNFTENYAETTGNVSTNTIAMGGAITNIGKMEIIANDEEIIFSGNVASSSVSTAMGGAIANAGDVDCGGGLTITAQGANIIFTGNTATGATGSLGGAIWNGKYTLEFAGETNDFYGTLNLNAASDKVIKFVGDTTSNVTDIDNNLDSVHNSHIMNINNGDDYTGTVTFNYITDDSASPSGTMNIYNGTVNTTGAVTQKEISLKDSDASLNFYGANDIKVYKLDAATGTVTFNLDDLTQDAVTARGAGRNLSIQAVKDTESFTQPTLTVADGTLVIRTNLKENTGDIVTFTDFDTIKCKLNVLVYDVNCGSADLTGSYTFLKFITSNEPDVSFNAIQYIYTKNDSRIVYTPVITPAVSENEDEYGVSISTDVLDVSKRYLTTTATSSWETDPAPYGNVAIYSYDETAGSLTKTYNMITTGKTWGLVARDWVTTSSPATRYYNWTTGSALSDKNELKYAQGATSGDISVTYDNTSGTKREGASEHITDLNTTYNVFLTNKVGDPEGGVPDENAFGGAMYLSNISAGESDIEIKADFIGNSIDVSNIKHIYGGAFSNSNSILNRVRGDFIANHVGLAPELEKISYFGGVIVAGGAIANLGTQESKIETLAGDFLGNYAYIKWLANYDYSGNVVGGAIYNYDTTGEIGFILGDFIGNYAMALDANNYRVSGGAISNRAGKIGTILSDFLGNYALVVNSGGQGVAIAGAIENTDKIGSITGNFTGNYAMTHGYSVTDQSGGTAIAGAIANITDSANNWYMSSIDSITSNFNSNYATSQFAIGGAIANYSSNTSSNSPTSSSIDAIQGDFIANYASCYGGAISNYSYANSEYHATSEISAIKGNFIGNFSYVYGGAIANMGGVQEYSQGIATSAIGSIEANFVKNFITVNDGGSLAAGGAIYNNGTIEKILNSNFTDNFVSCGEVNKSKGVAGGAIYNLGTIGYINGNFTGNYAYTYSDNDSEQLPAGGAIENRGTIDVIRADFKDNYVSVELKDMRDGNSYLISGGAIFNFGTIGVITGDFTDNTVRIKLLNEQYDAQPYAMGGAICNTIGTMTILADDRDVTFSGNTYTCELTGEGEVLAYGGAIMGFYFQTLGDGIINLNAEAGKSITFVGDSTGVDANMDSVHNMSVMNINNGSDYTGTVSFRNVTDGLMNSGVFVPPSGTMNIYNGTVNINGAATQMEIKIADGATLNNNGAVYSTLSSLENSSGTFVNNGTWYPMFDSSSNSTNTAKVTSDSGSTIDIAYDSLDTYLAEPTYNKDRSTYHTATVSDLTLSGNTTLRIQSDLASESADSLTVTNLTVEDVTKLKIQITSDTSLSTEIKDKSVVLFTVTDSIEGTFDEKNIRSGRIKSGEINYKPILSLETTNGATSVVLTGFIEAPDLTLPEAVQDSDEVSYEVSETETLGENLDVLERSSRSTAREFEISGTSAESSIVNGAGYSGLIMKGDATAQDSVAISNVTFKNMKALITNNGGTATLNNVVITDTTNPFVNNSGTLKLTKVMVNYTSDFNGERGVLTNDGTLNIEGSATIACGVVDSDSIGAKGKITLASGAQAYLGADLAQQEVDIANDATLNFTDTSEVSVGTFTGAGDLNIAKTASVTGDIKVASASESVASTLKVKNEGTFSGNLLIEKDETATTLNFINNGTWYPKFDSDGNSENTADLTLNATGIIDLTANSSNKKTSGFNTLNIEGNFTSAGGIFKINTDLANNTGDVINITGSASGDAHVKVMYDPFYDTTGTKIEGSHTFLTGGAKLAVNAVETEWDRNGTVVTITPTVELNGDDWQIIALTIGGGGSDDPSETTKAVSDTANIVNFAWLQNVNSLQKRLGDLRAGTASNMGWVRFQRSNEDLNTGRALSISGNLYQIGYDFSVGADEDSVSYVGVSLERFDGSQSFKIGGGDVKSTTVSAYYTKLFDTGHYFDVIMRYGRFESETSSFDNSLSEPVYSKLDYAMNGFTFSGEYGYRWQIGDRGFYIEPQVEVIYGHLSGAKATDSRGITADIDSTNHFITRWGISFGQRTNSFNYYMRASYYHDFAGGTNVTYGTAHYSQDSATNWWEVAIGLGWEIDDYNYLYAELTKYFKDISNSLNFNLGFRKSM